MPHLSYLRCKTIFNFSKSLYFVIYFSRSRLLTVSSNVYIPIQCYNLLTQEIKLILIFSPQRNLLNKYRAKIKRFYTETTLYELLRKAWGTGQYPN